MLCTEEWRNHQEGQQLGLVMENLSQLVSLGSKINVTMDDEDDDEDDDGCTHGDDDDEDDNEDDGCTHNQRQ